jgi:hypothetical protein
MSAKAGKFLLKKRKSTPVSILTREIFSGKNRQLLIF